MENTPNASSLIHQDTCPEVRSSAMRARRMSSALGAPILAAATKSNTAALPRTRTPASEGSAAPRVSQPRIRQDSAIRTTLNIRQFRIGDMSQAMIPIQIVSKSANVIALSGVQPSRDELPKTAMSRGEGKTRAANNSRHRFPCATIVDASRNFIPCRPTDGAQVHAATFTSSSFTDPALRHTYGPGSPVTAPPRAQYRRARQRGSSSSRSPSPPPAAAFAASEPLAPLPRVLSDT